MTDFAQATKSGSQVVKQLRQDANHGTTHYEGCACYLDGAADLIESLQATVEALTESNERLRAEVREARSER